jgi:hypothetical protein
MKNEKMIKNKIKELQQSGVVHNFGAYQDIIEQPSTKIWDGKGRLFSQRRTARKTWLFIGANDPNWAIGFAIVDAGLISKAFVYVYNLETKELWEDDITVPMGFSKIFDPSLKTHWKLRNYEIQSDGQEMTATYKGTDFNLKMQVQLNEKGLSFICPSKNARPFHFTYKNLLLSAKVEFELEGQTTKLTDLKAGIDFSKGYPPRYTFWNWTSFMGQTEEGEEIGINLVDGFNENIENAVWWGNGAHQLLGKVLYDYQPPLESTRWEVNAADASLHLQLDPKGARKENINALFLKSKFTQVYGPMQGWIKKGDRTLKIWGYGLMEEHEALW